MTPQALSTLDQSISFSVGDQQFTMSGAQVLDAARRALANGLPPEASNYLSWVAEVDGHLVGLKWLFSLATGLRSSAFASSQARNTLERMGVATRQLQASPPVQTTQQRVQLPSPKPLPSPARGMSNPGAHAALDAEIARVRAFLRGRGDRPSDERLCDWVHFCYTFELYAEGRDLFGLVDPASVNPWYYERTRRLAAICAMRTARKP